MSRTTCSLALVLTVLAVFVGSACRGSRRPTTDGVVDAGPPIVPFACLPGVRCASDTDCPVGHRCNFELGPPECQELYCGTPGTACSDDVLCEEALECWERRCTACTGCGSECIVDFSRDARHCGGCDQPVPVGGSCVDGAPVCPAGRTACGSRCVDLSTDPDHCGACFTTIPVDGLCEDGHPTCVVLRYENCDGVCVDLSTDSDNCGACGASVPAGLTCVGGAPGCPSGGSLCGDTCASLDTDDANCGRCGRACESPAHCESGSCIAEVSSRTRESCDTACADLGGSCVEGTVSVICGSGFLPGAISWDCTSLPPSSCDSSGAGPQPFYSIRCDCLL